MGSITSTTACGSPCLCLYVLGSRLYLHHVLGPSGQKGSQTSNKGVVRQKTRVPLIKHGILTYLDRPIQFFVARIRFYGSNSTIKCAKLIFSFFTDFVEILAFKW